MLYNRENTHKLLLLTTVLNADVRLSALAEDLKGEMLEIGLHFSIVKLATNETLGVEDTER